MRVAIHNLIRQATHLLWCAVFACLLFCAPAHAAGNASAPAQSSGTDYSANPPSLSGLTLLATIPAMGSNGVRKGYLIEAQCTAGLTIVFDDGSGSGQTILVLAGAGSNGAPGGVVDMAGMPHSGRILIYSSSAGCQFGARTW